MRTLPPRSMTAAVTLIASPPDPSAFVRSFTSSILSGCPRLDKRRGNTTRQMVRHLTFCGLKPSSFPRTPGNQSRRFPPSKKPTGPPSATGA
jgi:hypothetical protein